MADRILVWGAGGHGRVVRDIVQSAGGEVVGFVDRSPPAPELRFDPDIRLPCLSETELDQTLLPLGATGIALGIGDNRLRLAALERIGDRFPFPAQIHPTAVVGSEVRFGDGSVVMALAVVNARAAIGRAVVVNSGAIVEHDVVLEDGVHVGPGAVLCGGVFVGRGTLIGAGATIVPGRRIGRDAVVGAGSVVIRDVDDSQIVAGCPARPVERA